MSIKSAIRKYYATDYTIDKADCAEEMVQLLEAVLKENMNEMIKNIKK